MNQDELDFVYTLNDMVRGYISDMLAYIFGILTILLRLAIYLEFWVAKFQKLVLHINMRNIAVFEDIPDSTLLGIVVLHNYLQGRVSLYLEV